MFKTITVAAVLLVSPTEAIFGIGNRNKINSKVVKPDTNNGMNNFVGGKGQNIDDLYFGNDETGKLKKRITQLAQKSVDDEADKFKEALIAVMTQRIQDYLKVKNGSYQDNEVK